MCLSVAVHRPNDVLAKGEAHGFEWMVVHNGNGYRCGYVRVPAGHPWHGQEYSEIEADVHGGLTFGEPDVSCGKGDDDAFWFGFDCSHGFDLADPSLPSESLPSHLMFLREFSDNFLEPLLGIRGPKPAVRTQAYVEAECVSLCRQAMEAA